MLLALVLGRGPKNHFRLLGKLPDYFPWVLQGNCRGISFSKPKRSQGAMLLCLPPVVGEITVLGKDDPFGVKGEWEVGPLALPSSLVLFPHRNMCLCGGRGRRDNLIYDGCVLWNSCHNCLLGLGSNRQQNREKVCPEERDPIATPSTERLASNGAGFQEGEVLGRDGEWLKRSQ